MKEIRKGRIPSPKYGSYGLVKGHQTQGTKGYRVRKGKGRRYRSLKSYPQKENRIFVKYRKVRIFYLFLFLLKETGGTGRYRW